MIKENSIISIVRIINKKINRQNRDLDGSRPVSLVIDGDLGPFIRKYGCYFCHLRCRV